MPTASLTRGVSRPVTSTVNQFPYESQSSAPIPAVTAATAVANGANLDVTLTSNVDLLTSSSGFPGRVGILYSIGVGIEPFMWQDVAADESLNHVFSIPFATIGAVLGDTVNVQPGFSLTDPAGTLVLWPDVITVPYPILAVNFDALSGVASVFFSASTSYTHTPVGIPSKAIVIVSTDPDGSGNGVTYGGVAGVLIDSQRSEGAGGRSIYVYGVTGIPAGAQTVVANQTGAGFWSTQTITFTGGDATTMIRGATVKSNDYSGTISAVIASAVNDLCMLFSIAQTADTALTPGTDDTLRISSTAGGGVTTFALSSPGVTGNVTVSGTHGNPLLLRGIIGMSIKS